MTYRGKAGELLNPIVKRGVPKNWPFHTGYRLRKIDPERMYKLSEPLRVMYYAVDKWRDFAYSETAELSDMVKSAQYSPNNSPDLARKKGKDILEILENYHAVRSCFWRHLRQAYPLLKGKKVEIITATEGDCYAISDTDLEDLEEEGFGHLVSISRPSD
jgi:hypothetical protein